METALNSADPTLWPRWLGARSSSFLVLFVAGLALIGWMVHTTVAGQRHAARG